MQCTANILYIYALSILISANFICVYVSYLPCTSTLKTSSVKKINQLIHVSSIKDSLKGTKPILGTFCPHFKIQIVKDSTISTVWFLVQPLGWTPPIEPEFLQNRLFWLSMFHMILTRNRSILDLFAVCLSLWCSARISLRTSIILLLLWRHPRNSFIQLPTRQLPLYACC